MIAAKPSPLDAKVLIVDDEELNVVLLEDLLLSEGFAHFRSTTDPRQVPALCAQFEPDLILLDLMMPHCDGFEVMNRLRPLIPEGDFLPILVLTADTQPETRQRALSGGASDFLLKPIDFIETSLRIRNLLQTRGLHRQLREHNTLLAATVAERTAMLEQLHQANERLRELERLRENLTQMIIHDLNSPLQGISLSLDLLSDAGLEARTRASLVRTAQGSTLTLRDMIRQLLDISRLESGQMPLQLAEGNLVRTAQDSLDALKVQADGRRLNLVALEPVAARYDAGIIRRIMGNLLGNALKFTPKNGEVVITIARAGACVRVAVTDDGPGIAPEHHHKIFEKFSQLEGKERKLGVGLGLAFCKLAVEAHGGQIGVISPASAPVVQAASDSLAPNVTGVRRVGPGATFWIELPAV